MRIEILLRILFLGLAIFDFILGTVFIFFGEYIFSLFKLDAYALPKFFMICVGLFLYQYVYIQYMAFKDPYKHSTCLNMTLAIRLTFPIVYVSAIILWGKPFTLIHLMFAVSAIGDLVASAFILYSMKILKISFFQGDFTSGKNNNNVSLLRIILLVLAIAEFAISWNWILFPKFWLNLFDLTFIVDPFWTRATGLFLVNIAYIQFLGFLDVYKYRTAVITSGVFRALWPIFYWYWTAFGEGCLLFKGFIMFFSFFDTIACFTIFRLLKNASEQTVGVVDESKKIKPTPNLIDKIWNIFEKYFTKFILLLSFWDFCLGVFIIVIGHTLLTKYGFSGEFINLPVFFIHWTGFFIILQAISHYLFYLDIWNSKLFILNFLLRAAIGLFHVFELTFFMRSLGPLITGTLIFFIIGDLSTGSILGIWGLRNRNKYNWHL